MDDCIGSAPNVDLRRFDRVELWAYLAVILISMASLPTTSTSILREVPRRSKPITDADYVPSSDSTTEAAQPRFRTTPEGPGSDESTSYRVRPGRTLRWPAGLRYFPAGSIAALADTWPLAINSGAAPEIEYAAAALSRPTGSPLPSRPRIQAAGRPQGCYSGSRRSWRPTCRPTSVVVEDSLAESSRRRAPACGLSASPTPTPR